MVKVMTLLIVAESALGFSFRVRALTEMQEREGVGNRVLLGLILIFCLQLVKVSSCQTVE